MVKLVSIIIYSIGNVEQASWDLEVYPTGLLTEEFTLDILPGPVSATTYIPRFGSTTPDPTTHLVIAHKYVTHYVFLTIMETGHVFLSE